MASLHHPAAVLLTFGLMIGCGGDRSRAGASADTTGAAAVTPDSAGMRVADTTASPAPASADTAKLTRPDTARAQTATAPPRADTAKKPSAAAPAAKPPAKTATPTANTTRTADSTKTAAAPAPVPAQTQDTSSAPAEAPLRDAYHQAPHDTVSQAVYDGWKQFNLNCARCHGEDVLGTTIAPHLIVSLKPDGPINTKELFVQTVCAGRPEKGMPAWCALGLDMDKINDIYLYVKGRSDAKISPGRPAVKKEG